MTATNIIDALPDSADQARSAALTARLRERLQPTGSISFAEYMHRALYEPDYGYYMAAAKKFGAKGDFITAPEVSPLFGDCLANYCAKIFQQLRDLEQNKTIVEIGAGSGILAADILTRLAALDCVPDSYRIVEISPALREQQQQLLQQRIPTLVSRVQWLDKLPEDPITGIIFANEVLDAMPVARFSMTEDGIAEYRVVWDVRQQRFDWHLAPATEPLVSAVHQLQARLELEWPLYYCSEINLQLSAWLKQCAQTLAQGILILIDYGYPQAEYYHPTRSAGTVQSHYRHRVLDDLLYWPGLQDITAHVDFTAVATAADAAGLSVLRFLSQAHFLCACDIQQRLQQRLATLTTETDQWRCRQQLKTLLLPDAMGERFKVLLAAKGIADSVAEIFAEYDQRHRL